MYIFNKITVNPQLPKRIEKISEISNNLWWSWNTDFLRLFQMMDKDLVKDDKMASTDIQLCSLIIGQVYDQWYNLLPNKGVKKGGSLHLVIHIAPQGPILLFLSVFFIK